MSGKNLYGNGPVIGSDIVIYTATWLYPKFYNGIESCGGPSGFEFWKRLCFDPNNPPTNVTISNTTVFDPCPNVTL